MITGQALTYQSDEKTDTPCEDFSSRQAEPHHSRKEPPALSPRVRKCFRKTMTPKSTKENLKRDICLGSAVIREEKPQKFRLLVSCHLIIFS